MGRKLPLQHTRLVRIWFVHLARGYIKKQEKAERNWRFPFYLLFLLLILCLFSSGFCCCASFCSCCLFFFSSSSSSSSCSPRCSYRCLSHCRSHRISRSLSRYCRSPCRGGGSGVIRQALDGFTVIFSCFLLVNNVDRFYL